MQEILLSTGFDILTAQSGERCIELFEKKIFDLIFMDIIMPGMSGDEAIIELRKNPRNKNLKIIALTADVFLHWEQKLLTIGADEV
ncbi:response regulator [Candidatus Riflebacteria bacterium]